MPDPVHYEYYDGSNWCKSDDEYNQQWMKHPDAWAEDGNPLEHVTCKDCLRKMNDFGKAASRRYFSLLAKEETQAKAAWIIR